MSSYSGSDQGEDQEQSEQSEDKLQAKQKVTSVKTAGTTADSHQPQKKVESSQGSRNNDEELVDSASEEEHSEDEEEESEVSSHKDSEEAKAFMRKPLTQEELFNEDGTEKYQAKTKLMLRLEEVDGDEDSQDADNSFEDHLDDDEEDLLDDDDDPEEDQDDEEDDEDMEGALNQQVEDGEEVESPLPQESGDEDDGEDEDEESPDNSPATIQKKPNLQPRKQTIFDVADAPDTTQEKKFRRSVMNVACTEYDVVKRVAKKNQGFRLKLYDEDHEGAIICGEGGQKISKDWDVSWHDLGITADFLSKM